MTFFVEWNCFPPLPSSGSSLDFLPRLASGKAYSTRDGGTRASGKNVWVPCSAGYYKCNVDASFCAAQGRTSLSMCIRNDHEEFILARTEWIPYCLPTLEGEAIRLCKSIHWIQNLGLNYLFFESDCKV